jgi:hypothetical protein
MDPSRGSVHRLSLLPPPPFLIFLIFLVRQAKPE